MGSRGRKSIASMLLPDAVETMPRPDAPYDLAPGEVDVWKQITSSMAADHFAPSQFPLLCQLCRHVVASRRVGMLIEQAAHEKNINTEHFALLLKMQSAESVAILRLSRSMRLTHQATTRPESAKLRPLSTIDAPWKREPWEREKRG